MHEYSHCTSSVVSHVARTHAHTHAHLVLTLHVERHAARLHEVPDAQFAHVALGVILRLQVRQGQSLLHQPDHRPVLRAHLGRVKSFNLETVSDAERDTGTGSNKIIGECPSTWWRRVPHQTIDVCARAHACYEEELGRHI